MIRNIVAISFTLALALAITPNASAKNGCTVEGGNTLCCNCTGQGSCEASGCGWSGGLDGQCGLKGGGKEFMANNRLELTYAQTQFTQATAEMRRADAAFQQAKKRFADAQRAQTAAQKSLQRAMTIPQTAVPQQTAPPAQ